MGAEVSRYSFTRSIAREHAPVERISAPCRLGLRQRQCRVDVGQIQILGLRRADRKLRRLLPDAQRTLGRIVSAHEVSREIARAAGFRRSDLQSNTATTADIQRLFCRRRRYWPSGLRELRHARRL